jgi:prepilin-type N-terminal cleavage/methylation domain-containing protein
MSILKAYLNTPRAQRALKTKPGEQGFSLIELVVVVAVLAVLSAIAIPQFSSISGQAAHAAASNSLATIAKECAVKHAQGTANATHALLEGGNGVHFNHTGASLAASTCGTSAAPEVVCAYVSAASPAAKTYCITTSGTKLTGTLASMIAAGTGAKPGGAFTGFSNTPLVGTPPNATAW